MPATEQKKCSTKDCTNQARGAVKTQRPSRAVVKTTIWWDERTAPSTAEVLCLEHLLRTITVIGPVLCHTDEVMADA